MPGWRERGRFTSRAAADGPGPTDTRRLDRRGAEGDQRVRGLRAPEAPIDTAEGMQRSHGASDGPSHRAQ
jgi:hypothetical protein